MKCPEKLGQIMLHFLVHHFVCGHLAISVVFCESVRKNTRYCFEGFAGNRHFAPYIIGTFTKGSRE